MNGRERRQPRIVVLGSINQDVTVRTEQLPRPGETVGGRGLGHSLGGKGANQAVAAARAGASVAMIGSVGSDDAASALLGRLRSAGVDTARVRRVSESTGTALIVVDRHGENTIVVVPGANGEPIALDDADRAAIAAADLVLVQLELPLAVVIAAAAAAAAAGVPVLLNPSPGRELPLALLANVAILVANEGEAALIGGPALESVRRRIITLGARGAAYTGPEGSFEAPAPAVSPIDTTGAGDAFTGAFAAAWAGGRNARAAVELGCAAGALAATRPGAN